MSSKQEVTPEENPKLPKQEAAPQQNAKNTFGPTPPYSIHPLTVEAALVSVSAATRAKQTYGGTLPAEWNIVLTPELMVDILARIIKFS